MAEIHGSFDPAFEKVRDLLSDNIDSGVDVGASIAVDIDGHLAVDIWGGIADKETGAPWERDTIINVWSTTKTATNFAALICHERGLLDVYAPVAKYWPEFAANGKENIEVRHLLSHTSGVSGWEKPFTTEDLYDWDKATSHLAAQEPWWEPGTASGYHMLNQGHLVGEVVRRVSGKTLKQFVKDEIATPLGADFQVGAVEEDWPRIARLIPMEPTPLPENPDPVLLKTYGVPGVRVREASTPEWRNADIGAANGHSNARGVARALSPISRGGTVDGKTYLSPETLELIFDVQADGIDLVLGARNKFGIGFGLPNPETTPDFPQENACYWGGLGGSLILMDLGRKTTIAYMMNNMFNSEEAAQRRQTYARAIYEALG